MQQLRDDLLRQLNAQLDELFDNFISEVEQIEQASLLGNGDLKTLKCKR